MIGYSLFEMAVLCRYGKTVGTDFLGCYEKKACFFVHEYYSMKR